MRPQTNPLPLLGALALALAVVTALGAPSPV